MDRSSAACICASGREVPHRNCPVHSKSAATGRDTWNAGARPWKPCPNTEPHPRHEWLDGVKREDCPGTDKPECCDHGWPREATPFDQDENDSQRLAGFRGYMS